MMGMVNAENVAFAHVLAAANLVPGPKQKSVEGRTFFADDFAQNVITLYHELAGNKSKPFVLPYCIVWILTHVS